MVAAPATLRAREAAFAAICPPRCLVYTSVKGDDRWQLRTPQGEGVSVPVSGPLRSNSLSAVLAAARADMGFAVLPYYVARIDRRGRVRELMPDHVLPDQEIHAVYPSPKLVPSRC